MGSPLKKKIFRSIAAQHALAWAVASVTKCIFLTNKRERYISDSAKPYMNGEKPALFCFWHGRMMMIAPFSPPGAMHILISQHRDGVLISRVMHHFGKNTVEGSTSRGALRAGARIVKLLRKGENVSITPDGPRGPAQQMGEGALRLAQNAGVPLIPVTYSCSKYRRLSSWDRFLITLPFGRIGFFAGDVFSVPENCDEAALETHRQTFETIMNELVERADRTMGLRA